jgi:hypothetical protein
MDVISASDGGTPILSHPNQVPSGVDQTDAEHAPLVERLRRLEVVDVALIVSPGQNEVEEMKKLDLDMVPHRKRRSP